MYEGRETIESVLKKTDYLFVNKEEAEQLRSGKKHEKTSNENAYLRKLLVDLQKTGARIVVITNGKHGSYSCDEKGDFYFRGMHPGKVVERTGAGDAFSSGFLAATINGLSIPKAMDWGSANAASVVGKIGAEAGLLTKHEMEEKSF
jgi:sugar/nucleoside kinase (ribokinase family)